MDKRKNKEGAGRPKIYLTEEERIKAVRRTKAKYATNTYWYCDVCNNEKNYKM